MRPQSQEGSKGLFPGAWAVEGLLSCLCPRVRHPKDSTQFLHRQGILSKHL